MGIAWEWEWTTCNLCKEWEWELLRGNGRECKWEWKCGKISVPHSTDTEEQPPPLKKTRIENFEELCDPDEDTNPVRNELAD